MAWDLPNPKNLKRTKIIESDQKSQKYLKSENPTKNLKRTRFQKSDQKSQEHTTENLKRT